MFNVGGTSAGGGSGGLWSNNLFLSGLSQAGASMAGEGSVAAGLNRINQGVIAAQSKAKEQKRQQDLMSKLLGQGVDVSSDAEGGLTLKAGSLGDLTKILSDYGEGSELEVPEGGPRSEPGILELAAQDYTSDQNLRNETLRGFLGGVTPNPTSSSSDVPVSGIPDYSDLVGLTPQDMSQALAGAQETELLKQKISDSLADRRFRQQQLASSNILKTRELGIRSRGLNIEEDMIATIQSNKTLDRELKQAELDYKLGRLDDEALIAETDRLYKEALTKKVGVETSAIPTRLEQADEKLDVIQENNELNRELKQDELDYKKGLLTEKQLNDNINRLYKEALTAKTKAETGTIQTKLDQINRGLDIKQQNANTALFKSLKPTEASAAIKSYEYAQSDAGGNFKGTFVDFQSAAKTIHQKDFKAAVDDGYEGSFNEWLLEMAKAGAITIDQITDRAQAKADIAGQLYFKERKYIDDLDDHMDSESVKNKIFMTPPEDRDTTRTGIMVRFIDQNIISRGGKFVDYTRFAADGKTMIWTVEWPSGDVEEVRHVVRD